MKAAIPLVPPQPGQIDAAMLAQDRCTTSR